MNSNIKIKMLIGLLFAMSTSFLQAAIQYDQDVTPAVIFGSGNPNGSFTVDSNTTAKIEVGLRAKIPFHSGVTRTINSNGDGTYSYTLAETDHDEDVNTSNRWNFDFTINVDYLDGASSGENLDDFTYEIGVDSDPTTGASYLTIDPVHPNNNFFAPDHEMGDNSTANGGGTIYGGLLKVAQYNTALANNNVIQNSVYYGDYVAGYDPSIPGNYSIYLLVKDSQGVELARSEIQVLIGGAAPANIIPVAVDDSYTVNEDNNLVANDSDGLADMDANNNGVLANDSDANAGDTLTVSPTGTINANGGIGGSIFMSSDGTFTYTPPMDFNGSASFDFNVTDSIDTVSSSLTIVVASLNDAPAFDIQGDKVYYSLQSSSVQVVDYTNNVVLEPNGEIGQSVDSYTVTIDSDTQDILTIGGASIDNSGTLTLDFNTNNFGTAIVSVVLQDDGSSSNGNVNSSLAQTFNISHLKDGVFQDGFEDIVVLKVSEFIESSYNNPLFDALPFEDLPYYESQTDTVVFLSYRLQLKGDYESKQGFKVLQQWINEVLTLEEVHLK